MQDIGLRSRQQKSKHSSLDHTYNHRLHFLTSPRDSTINSALLSPLCDAVQSTTTHSSVKQHKDVAGLQQLNNAIMRVQRLQPNSPQSEQHSTAHAGMCPSGSHSSNALCRATTAAPGNSLSIHTAHRGVQRAQRSSLADIAVCHGRTAFSQARSFCCVQLQHNCHAHQL